MGVESDQLVYDYLSRVGDLAQTALPAAERRHLVARLRSDIDRQRGGSESASTVRKILGRLGSPDEVVEAVAGLPAPRVAPEPTRVVAKAEAEAEAKAEGGAPLAAEALDWWRLSQPRPDLVGEDVLGLPGMSGGHTVPDGDPPDEEPQAPAKTEPGKLDKAEEAAGEAEEGEDRAAEAVGFRWRRPWRSAERSRPRPRLGLVELLAAAALIAGAVLGSWIALAAGWAVAYASRRPATQFAALGIPGLAAGGTLVWLWGRFAGRWGEPIAEGRLGEALGAALPTTIKAAAVASALFLLWRSRRPG